jgi:hypothetical protein
MKIKGAITCGTRTLLAKSCITCGELKQASDYRMARGVYYQSECRGCQHISAKRADKKANARSQDYAVKFRDEWTERDLHELSQLTARKLPLAVVAKKLGRSLASINDAKVRYQVGGA